MFFCLGDFYKFLYLYIEADVSYQKKLRHTSFVFDVLYEKSSKVQQKICDCWSENLQMLCGKSAICVLQSCVSSIKPIYCSALKTVSTRCVKVWCLITYLLFLSFGCLYGMSTIPPNEKTVLFTNMYISGDCIYPFLWQDFP